MTITANTITKESIEAKIKDVRYLGFKGTTLTVCCITMENGYAVTGESACVDHANYDSELGEKYAYEDAFNQLWPLEGYLLKERMFQEKP